MAEERKTAKVVTINEGQGDVKVVLTPGGQILRKEVLETLLEKQQADLEAVKSFRDGLAAGDADAVARIVSETTDRLDKRADQMRNRIEAMTAEREKLASGDQPAVDALVKTASERLSRRVERMTRARDRWAALLQEL